MSKHASAGASLRGTTVETISQSMNTNRNVAIQITNYSSKYTLVEPSVYTYSGFCSSPPQPTINKNTQEVCSFSKTGHTACGAVGVLTYKILPDDKLHRPEKLAIMFSVPFNYNHYENWFALGVYEAGKSCNYDLYYQMYYERGPFKREKGTGSVLTYSSKTVDLSGTMSPQGYSVIKVELSDK
ncbi:DELTA-actitoxin-Afr1e-like [Astyanax mexicanus]|uniref:DELTA-actitoxin-Afr1e-like n=1 Tax=Astyanax mexicanus TaxID=7994 RepID=UPI0020CB0F47|nr:DELTA-actitoxin-Afr1e-like [Astyanax mexicanus]